MNEILEKAKQKHVIKKKKKNYHHMHVNLNKEYG